MKQNIRAIEKTANLIENFRTCYYDVNDTRLMASDRDGNVSHTAVLEWLIENPHMQEIANNINKAMQEIG